MVSRTLAELSYEAAVRALDLQERTIDQLRAGTGTLLAASSLTASFLGAPTIQRTGHLGTPASFALACLAGSIGSCVYILLPKSGLVFSLSAPRMYEELFDLVDETEMRKQLIYWLEDYWTRNQRQIDNLGRCYLGAAIALLLQLACWSWTLVAFGLQSPT